MNTPGASVTGAGAAVGAGYIGSVSETYSGGYGDPATPGPSVTLATRATALVWLSSTFNPNGVGTNCKIAPAVSGATTTAALDANGTNVTESFVFACPESRVVKLALTPGVNTFKEQYAATNVTLYKRGLVVLAP